MLHAFLFVLGFSAVFIAFGVSAGLLGQFLLSNQVLIRQLAGVIVIAFGLHTAGWLQIPFLLHEARLSVVSEGASPSRALIIGMAFAAGWTPCVGPILGSILLLASDIGTASAGFALLLSYSVGMALPFLAMAWSLSRFEPVLRWARRNGMWISRITGVFLIIIGFMLYSNTFGRLARWLSYWRDSLAAVGQPDTPAVLSHHASETCFDVDKGSRRRFFALRRHEPPAPKRRMKSSS